MSKRAKPMHGERCGGVVKSRGTKDGKRVNVFRAMCDECDALGPPSYGSQPRARTLAGARGWLIEKVRSMRTMIMTTTWRVLCPEHRPR